MAKIPGADLPRKKRVEIGPTCMYDTGLSASYKILAETGVNPDIRVRDFTEEGVVKVGEYIKTSAIGGDLRGEVVLNTKGLVEIGRYRGVRHRKGLPVRGQKTKTNTRIRKGPEKTIVDKKRQ